MSPRSHFVTGRAEHRAGVPDLDRLVAAYEAAGLDPPSRLPAVEAALELLPTLHEVHTDLAAEALTAVDVAEWLDDAIGRMMRALAVEQLRTVGAHHRRTHADLNELRHQVYDDFAGPADEIFTAINAAASRLPAGAATLDPEHNIDAGTVGELTTVLDACQRFGAMTSALSSLHSHRLRAAGALCDVLDIPTCQPQIVEDAFSEPLNPDPQRDALLQLLADTAEHGCDHVIVTATRGGYMGVSPRFITSRAERETRRVHLAGATTKELAARR